MNDHSTSETPAVAVNTVSKKFCLSLKRSLVYGVQDTIHDLTGRSLASIGLRKDEFWANHDVSFDVNRGECVGLIGHNGAGKTTVLKMLNGLIKPDRGSITLRGRVGALIALGAGFNPVLTGRENIFINGAVLGLSRREVESQFDEIIDFAEIGDFIDTPVRSYSSGMQVRLGFAVATAMKPDILLIDEVLAVGDLDFRMKCITRISKLVDSNTAVVLVSHSMTDIQRICNRTIVMDHGRVAFDGDVSAGIAHYEAIGHRRKKADIASEKQGLTKGLLLKHFSGSVNGQPIADLQAISAQTSNRIEFRMTFQCLKSQPNCRVRLYFDSKQAGIIASLTSATQIMDMQLEEGTTDITILLPAIPLRVGAYVVGVSVHTGKCDVLLPQTIVGSLHIIGPKIETAAHGDAGLIQIESHWNKCEQSR